MDAATLCRLFFSLGTAVDLGGTLIPSFRSNIMNYGSRNSRNSRTISAKTPNSKTALSHALEYIAEFQVPHSWFTHYYVVSVGSSLFWGYQMFRVGVGVDDDVGAGGRRLYESLTLTRPSKSRMWVGLYLIGIAYYVFMGISVVVEGAPVLNSLRPLLSLLEISTPSLKTAVAIPLFLVASAIQNDSHRYLASLKKYSLPQRGLFKHIVCPHYTSECLIYIALAIISAPPGQVFNKTVLAGLGFVVSNLGVTADSTKKWYAEKFGAENVKGRWRMIPYLY
ncbi:Polyprenol reductase [Lachnellula suecica]|uniref:Polyprenal reductase n=1 Tax=Lachnellula suecica TaxID=602035 RepID=A0A8T9CBW8_9HELO|nr:Polyprenol reductase [Lachnellula suecica]